ncbi:MAG TPA: FAD binding domain-containing protein [Terriglobia bacterium]|nr:FAD binding domain-containing protein [Terriglobia bacterium]
MRAFEFAAPKTLQEAVGLLASNWGETEVLAGGTDLISAMKDQATTPKRVVSLKHVAGLGGVSYTPAAGLRIGAMATIGELLDSKVVQTNYPGLIQAATGIRSQQLYAVGTVGGELLQRPRCWYFRNGFGLLAQQQGKSLVPDGDNRYHAILGNSGPAYFVNPSSLAPMLVCLQAKVKIQGPSGNREVELGKFYKTPASADEREYDLKPNEILTEIVVPHHAGAKTAVYEVRQKEALDWPLAAAAVGLHMQGNTVKGCGIVLGHVAPVPWPSQEAEDALSGKEVSEETAEAAGKAAVAKATPLSKNAYKVQLASVAVKRAILAAAKGGA